VILVIGVVRMCMCPALGSKPIVVSLSVLIVLVGGAAIALAVYALFFNADLFSAYLGSAALYGIGVAGLVLVLISCITMVGIVCKSKLVMLLVFCVILVLLLTEVAGTIFIFYYVWSLNDIAEDSLETIEGTSSGRWEGRFASEGLAEMEGIICRTYVLCCRDPNLDGQAGLSATDESTSGDFEGTNDGTCFAVPAGATNDVATSLGDPASENFCKYVSGSKGNIIPADGTCDALDRIGALDQPLCQQNFCQHGIDGYGKFITDSVEFIKNNAVWFGVAGAFLVMIQGVVLVNAWNLRKRFSTKRDSKSSPPKYNGGIMSA